MRVRRRALGPLLGAMAITALLVSASGCLGVRGNEVIENEDRDVGAFDTIEVRSVFVVEIASGEDQAVAVTADQNLLEYVTTTVEGSTLVIDTSRNVRPSDDILVRVELPELRGIRSAGASRIYASTFAADRALDVSVSGSGLVEVAGEASSLSVDVSGSGKVQADRLVCSTASVSVSGSGKVYVDAEDELDIRISGSGSVLYSIEPASLKKAISGSGQVRYVGG